MLEFLTAEFPLKKRYLIGVSGGWDSMALLETLLREGYRDLVVCHLNHRLRGLESDEDAEFVRLQAEALGVNCVVECEDVAERAQRQRQSIETAARYARYDFFNRCSSNHGTTSVFLAHQAHDQAETLLLNLCRGTGRLGLTGMQVVTRHWGLTVIRPFLKLTRAEIPAPAAFREDSSNRSLQFSRNRVRWELMASLTQVLGRDPTPGLIRTAEILAGEEDYLAGESDEVLDCCRDDVPDSLLLHPLRGRHPAIQRRVLRDWLKHEVPDLSFEDVEAVRGLIGREKPSRVNLSKGLHVARRKKRLYLE